VFSEDMDVALNENRGLAGPGPCRHRDVLVYLVRRRRLFW